MTVIAGLVAKDGTIWMSADSAITTDSLDQYTIASPKVFQIGPFLIGCCGGPRVMDVMRYVFVPPKHPRGMDVQRFMRTLFVDAMRDAMRKSGSLHVHNAVEEFVGSELLVGYRRRLFDVDSDFMVLEFSEDYSAVGSGHPVARGALFVSADKPPRARLLAAMSAAERFNAGVRRPFTVVTMEAK